MKELTFDDCRPVVKQFAIWMEERLLANDMELSVVLRKWIGQKERPRIFDEANELIELFNEYHPFAPPQGRISQEAADVANFAMMLSDLYGLNQ